MTGRDEYDASWRYSHDASHSSRPRWLSWAYGGGPCRGAEPGPAGEAGPGSGVERRVSPWADPAADQAFGAVIERTSSALSSCSSVSSPRSTKPSAITASRTEMRSATACLAIFAADS